MIDTNPVHHSVFITGGTGYLGRGLIPRLIECGCTVRALARPESLPKLPGGCTAIAGNALDERTYQDEISPADTFVHLVGVSHPGPGKAELFRTVDLASTEAAVKAALHARIKHFVYVSVAHPAPVMKAYIEARKACEALIRNSGLDATILRPWYVLGPGHRWPYLLIPFYKICEKIPATAESAARLGLLTLPRMLAALQNAVEHPAQGIRIVEAPEIRRTRGVPSKMINDNGTSNA